MKEPLVSVIIACFNAEQYIDDCLNSLINQTYKNLEIIVCDDSSKDGSYSKLLEWSARDPRIFVLHNEQNMFAAATRNKCIKASHGDYLMIQDVDDISKQNRVEVLLSYFEKNPSISIVSSSIQCFRESVDKPLYIYSERKEYPSKYSFLWGISFVHPASMITRECIETVGGYRVAPETRRCQDYDMFIRMYAEGFKGMNIKEVLYYYRLDEANYRRRTWKARVGEHKIRKYGYKKLGMMPWAYVFTLKPFLSHFIQFVKNTVRHG